MFLLYLWNCVLDMDQYVSYCGLDMDQYDLYCSLDMKPVNFYLIVVAFCKYNKRTRNVGACDPDTNTETVSESLKKAVGRIECDPTRSYVRPCKMIGGNYI